MTLSRRGAKGKDWFVRRRHEDCQLPLADAERLAKEEESEAEIHDRQIAHMLRQIEVADGLLKKVSPSEWGALHELRTVSEATITEINLSTLVGKIEYALGIVLSKKPSTGKSKSKTKGGRKIDSAIRAVFENPSATDAEIAASTGCDRSYLSKNDEYQENAKTARTSACRHKETLWRRL